MPICFVISPIGPVDSEIRQRADDLFEEIATALEPFGLDAIRGDHDIESREIESDVIERIQNSELCIADLSEENINVYYELGRRDETGKPIVLVRRRGSADLPKDLASRRSIDYEIDTRRGAREFRERLRLAVKAESANGFKGSEGKATLSGVMQAVQRLERKVDRLSKTTVQTGPGPDVAPNTLPEGLEPLEAFRVALRSRNIPLAEAAMDRLQWTMDKNRFYDVVVEQIAAMGSQKATQMLFDYAQEFFDSDMSFKEKIEYLGVMVGAANRYDREFEILALVENTARVLDEQAHHAPSGSVQPSEHVQVFNQLNRLYYGIYSSNDDVSYLQKAIDALNKALTIHEAAYLYFNLAVCERNINLESARDAIDRCMELSSENVDDDHLELACKIYRKLDDPRYDDMLDRLREINPYKAMLVSSSD